MRRRSIAFLCLIALAGCKTGYDADLYVSDVTTALEGDRPIAIPATVWVEMPSQKTCLEKAQEMIGVFQAAFVNPRDPECKDMGMNARLSVTVDMDVLSPTRGHSDGAVVLGARPLDDGSIEVLTGASSKKLQALQDAITRANIPASIDFRDATMTVTVRHDGRDDATILAGPAFIDGNPVVEPTEVAVTRRDPVTIRLSDVAVAAATQTSLVRVFTLPAPPTE